MNIRAGATARILWTHTFRADRSAAPSFVAPMAARLRQSGIELHDEYLGSLRTIGALLRARKRVGQLFADADLLHCHYGSACALASAIRSEKPRVLSLRGNDWEVHRGFDVFHLAHTRLSRLATLSALGHFDCILPVSHRIANEVRRRVPTATVEVIPTAIDLGRFCEMDRMEARSRLGRSGDARPWVLFTAVQLNDPIKRYALALSAVAEARRKRRDIHFEVATEVAPDKMPLLVAAADVLLCTSESEGWPNAVKEALACNVPFVSTDVSDLGRIAALERSCTVCAATPRDLAAGLLTALEARGATDLRRHVASMGMAETREKLLGVYSLLLGGPVRGTESSS
jgi:teichuronic acid biosynthesis glycosyltransferase TuaC